MSWGLMLYIEAVAVHIPWREGEQSQAVPGKQTTESVGFE